MSEKRIWIWDQVELTPSKITNYEHDAFGPVTVFHDIPVARVIIQQYEDGRAYKSAEELENAYWTAEGRWARAGGHPETSVIFSREDVNGRTINLRFTKSLKDTKTRRPIVRGIMADLEVFDNRVAPDTLNALKTGKKRDVSIGFSFERDATPGTIDEDGHPLNGASYDYLQRNIMIDHIAFALEEGTGRCPFPSCGIGADQIFTALDPFAGYAGMSECIEALMKPKSEGGQGYTREQAAGTCAEIEKKSKEKHKSDVTEVKSMNTLKKWKAALEEHLSQFDDLVEEEYQGNLTPITESERAKRHFNISEDDWEALTEEEKEDYISRLPPKKDMDEAEKQWWELLDWNEMGNTWYLLSEEFQDAIYDAGLIDCGDCEAIDATDASEAEKSAAKKRCAKYPVSFKEGKGHVTKPKQYADIPAGSFADPCNFKYPYTEKYVMAAWSYISKPENKSKGGYSDAEWSWMRGRVKAAMKRHGHKVAEEKDTTTISDEISRAEKLLALIK